MVYGPIVRTLRQGNPAIPKVSLVVSYKKEKKKGTLVVRSPSA